MDYLDELYMSLYNSIHSDIEYTGFIKDAPEDLSQYGTPRHSGRYPWGSGENPYQRYKNFTGYVRGLQNDGVSLADIAKSMNISRDKLQARLSIAKDEVFKADVALYRKLKEKGWSRSAIARKMGVNESTLRGYDDNEKIARHDLTMSTANLLEEEVKAHKFVEVGKGIEVNLGNISETRKDTAVEILRERGYDTVEVSAQLGRDKKRVKLTVLCPQGTTKKDVYDHIQDIVIPGQEWYIEDGKHEKIEKPVVVSKNRIFVNYTDENGRGGADKDGVIELRRGVDDISLGKAQYAQVRIAVEGNQYMKGMAVYSDNIPEGYDIIYNTNKTKAQASKVFKNMKLNDKGEVDYVNPFGASIKTDDDPESEKRNLKMVQRHYIDADGNRQQSALNIVNEEGDWENWGRTLSSQVLSKQRPYLAKKQLAIVYDRKMDEFNEIMQLTNPTIKRQLLQEFADNCDSAAVHLKAAAIPGSSSHVILPIMSLKPNEVFAPGYEDGSRVALIRYPHGGQFEIPDLIVNNRNREAIKVIGKGSPDAVGINPSVAQHLSGADFDGDTVTVIPNNSGDIRSMPHPAALKNYEPKILYARKDSDTVITGKPKPGMTPEQKAKCDGFDTQREMGKVSNLITDMTIKGASYDKIYRAVKHSMTVIDAEKHNLDWKQSYNDNRIAELKAEFQGINDRGQLRGASTLISMAKSTLRIPEIREGKWVPEEGRRLRIDPNTGEKLYEETGKTHKVFRVAKNGKERWKNENIPFKEVPNETEIAKMAYYKDAFKLSSGQPIETVYATHANKLKALANQARKESVRLKDVEYNPSAYKVYYVEAQSLKGKLNEAKKNKPYERKARALAESLYKMRLQEDPSMYEDKDKAKKVKSQCLEYARKQTGAKKKLVKFSDREWEAIQAGAIHKTMLIELMSNCDKADLKQRAMPRQWASMSPQKEARVRQMARNGATLIEIAQTMGVSKSTISNILYGDDDD